MKSDWDIESAIATYNVEGWGEGYFTVNSSGNVEALPLKSDGGSIDLLEVVNEARARNLSFPLLIRFQDLLRHRVESINRAFQSAISEFGYQNLYRGVFPIKVNQLREVVEEIVDAGEQFHFGLEAGSKPELVAALAMQRDPETLIICNGYKDPAFIRIALLGRKLGKRVVIVAEKLEEVEQIIRASKEVGVEPWIGIRARLHSKGSGKWSPSGGENAKFGLDTTGLVAASQMLKDAELSHCLKLVHFHVGSQVPDISVIKRAVREGARYYAKLSKLGHELGYLDVGGGLGVDYDGSRSDFDSSTNYSLQEYANDVVWNIMDVCDSEGVPHPAIVSESGRATVAHHSVLVVEAFSSIEKTPPKLKVEANEKDHKLVADILEIKQRLKRGNRLESLHDIQQIKEEAQQTFDLGLLDLESKAKIDTVYWQIAHQIVSMHRGLRYVPDEVKQLETKLGDQYICNFSVFQSLLDHWALGQLFPIMPIHRLTTPPDRHGTLVDITCDSDGRVCKFIDLQDVKETLPLHRVHPGEIYYLGLFMVGAYQDIMGDLHNLFGRVTGVHVFLDPDEESGWYIEEVIEGSTIGEVLAMTQWDKVELMRRLKAQVDDAIKTDRLKPNDAMRLLDDYERFLQEYTYLSFQWRESTAATRQLAAAQLMSVAGVLVRLIAILIVAAALPCRAQDLMSGRWEGSARIPDDELTVIVDLAQQNGAWVGSIIIPGLGVKGMPLTDIKVEAPDAKFAVKGALGIQMNLRLLPPPENKLAGNFEQAGDRAPITLQKTGPPQVEYPLRSTPVAKELEGEWKGDYEMMGNTRHVSIKFANHPDGATADFIIVGRKHNVFPVDLITQEGDLVTVDSHEIGFSFEGRLRDGKLNGAIRQGAMETPLVLVHAK